MRAVPLGSKGSMTLVVAPEHLANRTKDPLLPPVLSTPTMILMMEQAAFNALRPYLEPGESTVGIAVDIRHLAATPPGERVTAEAEVTEVRGHEIAFRVSARNQSKKIGEGTHRRALIALAPFVARLEANSRRTS